MIRTIGERYIEKDKVMYAVFTDLEKTFDRVDWTKLMGILKETGVDWKERKLLSNLHMKQDRRKKVRGKRNWKGIQQGCLLTPTLFNIYFEDLMKNCFPTTEGVNIGGRRIKCIRFADDMALLAEDERMLMGLNGRCEDYGMKTTISKTKTMVIERKPKKIDIRIKGESIEQVDSFKY